MAEPKKVVFEYVQWNDTKEDTKSIEEWVERLYGRQASVTYVPAVKAAALVRPSSACLEVVDGDDELHQLFCYDYLVRSDSDGVLQSSDPYSIETTLGIRRK